MGFSATLACFESVFEILSVRVLLRPIYSTSLRVALSPNMTA